MDRKSAKKEGQDTPRPPPRPGVPVRIVFRAGGAARAALLFFRDLARMVDVNDFGGYLARRLARRFLALSGVVTLFSLVGAWTKHIVYGGSMELDPSRTFMEHFLSNLLVFGVPGLVLLLLTQVFAFFNRANFFTAQANYLNLMELSKRTPIHLDRLVQKLWKYVYRKECALQARGTPEALLSRRVRRLARRRLEERARLVRAVVAPPSPAPEGGGETRAYEDLDRAKRRYKSWAERNRWDGYRSMEPWETLSLRERVGAVSRILREETAAEITRQGLHYSKVGFSINAAWSLSVPMHLNVKYHRSGLDLKLVEDWLDGAFFDRTDVKLIEQYMAESTIKSAKLQARVPVFPFIALQGWRTALQRFWCYLFFGITSKRIGRYLNHLNLKYVPAEGSRYDRDYFKAEAFFWRSPAYDRLIREELGEAALARLNALRERWLFLTLGRLKKPRVRRGMTRSELRQRLRRNTERAVAGAARLLRRLFAGSVYNIHELRLRYDPDYVIEVSERDLASLEDMGLARRYAARTRRWARRRVPGIRAFVEELPALLASTGLAKAVDPEGWRALRIAHYLNEGGFRRRMERAARRPGDDGLGEALRCDLERILSHKENYSRKIRKLGIFHTLSVHHLKAYAKTAARLYLDLQKHYRRALEARLRPGPAVASRAQRTR